MNATNSYSMPSGPANTLGGADLRNLELTRVALAAVESLRQNSISLLKSASAAGVSATQAALDAVKAIWAMMMAILRFLARLFGVTESKGPKAIAEEAEVSSVGNSVDRAIKKVDANAAVAKAAIGAAAKAGVPEGNAFLLALQYGGLDGASAAMHGYVQNPQAFAQSLAPERMIEAALNKAAIAMDGLDKKSFQAQKDRADAAAHFNSYFLPPLLIDDLIAQFRQVVKDETLSDNDKPAVTSLLKADDALKAIVAHKKTIGDTLALAAAAAKKAGAELMPHAELMTRVVGQDWGDKVQEFLDHLASTPVPTSGELVVMGELSDRALEASAQAKSFLSGLTLKSQASRNAVAAAEPASELSQAKPLTAKERLRQSALAAEKAGQALPEFPTDHSRQDDDDQNHP